MARMIPAFFDDNTPPGEREVFSRFAAGPPDWTVLHALDLAPWNRGLRTEIDFVVIIPDAGILCIEVKSHRSITFDGQRWLPSEIRRSPFKQAADGRFSFYRRLRELVPGLDHVPVVHCCIFPQARFDLGPSMSVAQWELMDTRSYQAFRTSDEFCNDLRARVVRGIEADCSLRALPAALSNREVAQILEICLPVQRHRPEAREEVLRREESAANVLREQQKPVIRLAELNDRVIVSGGAGTGKTLIAMEVARRAAERGRRVALLCFNQLVGDWVRRRVEETGPLPPNLVIGRAIRVMAEMTGVVIPDVPPQEYWETDLPMQLAERLTDPDLEAASAFDYIVLDEAQDLLARPRLWECLTQFLDGGTDRGAFALFGDFDHQVLGCHERMSKLLADLERSARPVRWHLSENCRNYRIVGETALSLSGMPGSVYSGYLRTGGSHHNYDIFFYEDQEGQLTQIQKWLRELREQGYKASEITLLSFCGEDASAATSLKRSGYKLQPAWKSGDRTTHASVHAFKGMENKVILLTDVMLTDHDFRRDLFYTGMTRATECIRVLCHKQSEAVLCEWLAGKVSK